MSWKVTILLAFASVPQLSQSFAPMSSLPLCNPIPTARRSKRILRRSSSLGEESQHDHYAEKASDMQPDAAESSSPRRFTIGLLADIQYAPIPDGYSYSGVPRYYRHALDAAAHAAEHFQKEQVAFVVNLGDIVDGKCQDVEDHGGDPVPPGTDPGLEAVEDVLRALGPYRHGPILHAYGNHCLYNLDRPTLAARLGIPFVREPCGDLVGYYRHGYETWSFITLDSYDIGLLQRCQDTSQKWRHAEAILRDKNPNFDANINSPEGLVGVEQRFVGFNGAVGAVQLAWLREQLEGVRLRKERCIILSHQPILPGSSSPVCLIWNYKEILAVLREFSDVIVASFAGHAHKGGYKRDSSGIHFRVFEAVLESPHPERTYAMIDIYDDRLLVRGFGRCKSACYRFDHQPPRCELITSMSTATCESTTSALSDHNRNQ